MRTRRSPRNQDRLFKELGREKAPVVPCEWIEDSDGWWRTGCDKGFVVNDGTPAENGFKYCCYCGKPLKEIPFKETEVAP